MSSPEQTLDLLRKEIDGIDLAIHELIVKRGTIVEDIRKIKDRGGPALRPGREATILRQLVERHRGRFPLRSLICLWREMMGGFTHMQAPVSVAVLAPPGRSGLLALARDHYGGMSAMTPHPSAAACVGAVGEGRVQVAVLPLPSDGDPEPWWQLLMSNDEKTPKVVSRLPFVVKEGAEEALVIAAWDRDSSELESSLLALRVSERASRSRILAAVTAAGFQDAVPYAMEETGIDDCCYVVEVGGMVRPDDGRLKSLPSQFGGLTVEAYVIGGYARQLAVASGAEPN